MSFQLRREEVLDGDQLSAMLAENPAKAAQAILMAAKQGIVDGQALLGQILLDGQGIKGDPVLAKRWFQIAANEGHLMARNMLGRCWEHGWGGPVDFTLAVLNIGKRQRAGWIGRSTITPICWRPVAVWHKTRARLSSCIGWRHRPAMPSR